MFSIFGRKTKCIECCYCAKMMRIAADATMCECGQHENPSLYMAEHGTAKPFYMPIVGWTDVGKTIWIFSVVRQLKKLSSSVWPSFLMTGGDKTTMEFCREVEAASEKVCPQPTQLGVKEAYIFLLKNMPLWGRRTLVIRDVAGEHFKDFETDSEQAIFLKNSRSAFFMYSLADLKKEEGQSMEQMLENYVLTLSKPGVTLEQEQRKIVVILSKLDLMQSQVPKHLLNYIRTDPIALAINASSERRELGPSAMSEYMDSLNCMSDEIKAWIKTRDGGANFINLAKEKNIDLRFCIISCLDGPDESNGKMGLIWNPYRVLDPIFLSLDIHSAKGCGA